ncbi:MAG: exodeoxyribonuclease III [Chloroflexi bacterium]|nr:exodeoxyribonuclease III [Chloroflexota bacterium]|tara:strand:+ start:2595 stop:3359 length:765 start_codon:yes stop_codon:yes gene_type:complete
MNIISWNVNGLRAVSRKGFHEWIDVASPDVLCVQETKLSEDKLAPELREIAPYKSHFSFADRKGYSGVAIYSKSAPVSVETTLSFSGFDDEGRHQFADFGDFILANIYFPNGRMSKERLDYKLAYYEAFLEYAKSIRSQGRNLVVCGDVNTAHREIDLARPKENSKVSGFLPVEREWMDKFLDSGFVDTFRMFDDSPEKYSWWSQRARARERNVGWRLDYFFVNEEFAPKVTRASIVTDVIGSDHCPVEIELDI